jgi:hypothetical protein
MMPILVIGVVIAAAVILTLLQKGRMNAVWSGRVDSISRRIVYQGGNKLLRRQMVVVRYRTNAGKRGKFELEESVFARYFPDLQTDDGLIKSAQEGLPRKA